MFQIKVVEKVKIHILFSVTFPEIRAVHENVEKRGAREVPKYNMVAHCMLDK
jgi:hypothetical protein